MNLKIIKVYFHYSTLQKNFLILLTMGKFFKFINLFAARHR